MKRKLYLRFLAAYFFLAIWGLVIISTAGSAIIEKQITKIEGRNLYRETMSLASFQSSKSFTNEEEIKQYYDNLKSLAAYQDAQILILTSSGVPIIDTALSYDSQRGETLKNFDPAAITSDNFIVSDFFGYFDKEMINTMVPITSNLTTKGYISMHMGTETIVERREAILGPVYIIFLILFASSLLILLLLSVYVYRPLRKITIGAAEYASGNLDYHIPVDSDDEMGYLADTLNYMSDELNKMSDYQRKFVANVSHDFRSPLTSIKGFVEAIIDGTIPGEMQEKYLKIVVGETERLEKLTQSLLTLDKLDSRGRPIHKTNFDINTVIKNTAATFEGTCRSKRLTIELHLQSERLLVNADLEQIQQVLYNLLDNAIKFSPNDASVKIETSERYGTVFVSVKDQGTGIPKNSLHKIWDRFYKTDTSRGKDRRGTGLGLSIVKEIITAHNQNINVISTEGVGSEFIFTLEKSRE